MFQSNDNFQDIIHYFNTFKDIHASNSLRERIVKETNVLPRRSNFFLPYPFLQAGIAFAGLVIIFLGISGLLIGGQQVLQKGHTHLGAPSRLQISPAPIVSVTITQIKLKPTVTPTPVSRLTPVPTMEQSKHNLFEEAIHKVVNNVFHISRFGDSNKEKSRENNSSVSHHDGDN